MISRLYLRYFLRIFGSYYVVFKIVFSWFVKQFYYVFIFIFLENGKNQVIIYIYSHVICGIFLIVIAKTVFHGG